MGRKMAKVEVFFEVELPFWLGLKDGLYEIMVNGKVCPIELSNQ